MNNRKILITIFILIVTVSLSCCKNEESIDPVIITISPSYSTIKCKVLEIVPKVSGATNATYKWAIGDSVIGQTDTLQFISNEAKTYAISLVVSKIGTRDSVNFTVAVQNANYSLCQNKLLEYKPAYSVGIGNTIKVPYNDFLNTVNDKLTAGTVISLPLGCFGGTCTYAFDHTIVNKKDTTDFSVTSASGADFALGIIYVAYDKNKNGIPDDNEWYEIAGSYYDSEEPDYQVTYSNYIENVELRKDSANWVDNRGNSGKLASSYSQSATAFPGILRSNMAAPLNGWNYPLVLKGRLLKVKGVQGVWGYASLANLGGLTQNIDIDWAVDSKGNYVHLMGIDFIKIQMAQLMEKTEGSNDYARFSIREIRDLHIK